MVCRSVGFWRAQGGASLLQAQLSWCRGSQASSSHRLWHSSPSSARARHSTRQQTQRSALPAMASSAGTREQGSQAAASAAAAAEEIREAPFGAWESPLTAALVSSGSKRLGGMGVASGDRLMWMEGRPAEGGRSVIMGERLRDRDGAGAEAAAATEGLGDQEVTPAGMSVKSKVHEYGGGAFAVRGETLVFCNQSDQRVYQQTLQAGSPGAPPAHPLTPEYADAPSAVRYADFDFDAARGCVYCVREDGRQGGAEAAHEPVNDIVAISLSAGGGPTQEPRVVESGADFYAFPRLSPDGSQLAWVQWSHPNMPWDSTSLWVAQLLPDGSVSGKTCVAGGDEALVEAPTEPAWSPAGDLFFVTDRGGGFWNIHRAGEGQGGSRGQWGVELVLGMQAEFSRPFWVFGNNSFAFVPGSDHHLVCSYQENGTSSLGVVDTRSKQLTRLPTDLTDCFSLAVGEKRVFVAGGAPSKPYGIYEVHLGEALRSCTLSTLWETFSLPDPTLGAFFSTPRWVSFEAPTFPGQLSHAVFYPPHSPRFRAPAGEGGKAPLPPLLVRCHGGPTGATDTMLRLPIQFWTSRGWAVADVNYSGSTGYGRAYRERLYGQWGVADVADASACARFLAEQGLVDGARVATDGSSAGGFTCFASLTFTDTFKAGCSLYGICDLALLADSDHKFEKYYCDHLVGPLPAAAAVYKERSPIHHIDKLSCPVILFQGLDDKVVPPSQARLMYEAVKAKGVPTALVEYPGEGHGFRQGPNIEQTLEQEYLFFARVLLNIWEVPGISRELVIENLSRPSEP